MKEIKKFHFYASSIGEWAVNTDVEALVKRMKTGRLNFNLWKVPGDITAEYPINQYAPDVEGRVYLGVYTFNDGKKWAQSCEE